MNARLPHTGIDAEDEEKAYDDAPYESNPFAHTQPARLAAVAHLFGLNPAAVGTARVLELGCASGGNLVPLAVHFPQARFVGIDISGKQIADGQALVARLGLQNIELRHLDIQALTPEDGQFDYIVCHGIYSWVPAPVRDAILRVCSENLADDGVAFVSYNTLPGWHYVQPMRDMMLYWTQDITAPQQKVTAALELLAQLKDVSEDVSGNLYRKEWDMLKDASASYILHDHLEQTNAPCYFKDFAAHAQRHGLAYLSDIAFRSHSPLNITPLMTDLADRYAGGDIVRAEQLLDFMRRRRFRESLLVKQSRQQRIDRCAPMARLDALHFRLFQRFTKDPMPPARMTATWWHSKKAVFRLGATTVEPDTRAQSFALDWLTEHASTASTFTLEELVAYAIANGETPAQARDDIRMLLWDLLATSALRAMSCAVQAPIPKIPGDMPAATPLARAAAAMDNSSTANVFHERVRLSESQRRLLLLLDGTRNAAAVADALGEGATEEAVRTDIATLADLHVLC
ncbi:MAG: class I SAM-dependent methyltransferase [Pseudomonadota bacterium]